MIGQLAGLAVALQRTRELEPAHVGEHPIDEHEVRPLVSQRRARRAAILSFPDFKSGSLQPECDHLADRALILNYQNLFCGHVLRSVARAYYRCSMLQIHDKEASH